MKLIKLAESRVSILEYDHVICRLAGSQNTAWLALGLLGWYCTCDFVFVLLIAGTVQGQQSAVYGRIEQSTVELSSYGGRGVSEQVQHCVISDFILQGKYFALILFHVEISSR
jgi:hypothetical protein